MKKRLTKILGVALTLALLSSVFAVLPSGALGQPSVTLGAYPNSKISEADAEYTIITALGKELVGGDSFYLPNDGDLITITDGTGGDSGLITITAGTVTITGTGTVGTTPVTGPGTSTWSTTVGQTIIITADVGSPPVTGSFTQTTGTAGPPVITDANEAPTVAAAPGGVFTLPDIGDEVVFSDSAAAAEQVTLTTTTGAFTVVMSGTGTHVAGLITFDGTGTETATITATAVHTTGTWAQTTGTPTAAAGTNAAGTTSTLTSAGGSMTVTLPVGTTVGTPTNAAISASPGWVAGSYVNPVVTGVAWSHNATYRTITATLGSGDKLGEGATVRIFLPKGITNPATPADYTLTVKTSREVTAVTSNAYSIISPIVLPSPGTVELYNPAGILMNHYTGAGNLLAAVAAAGSGYTIKVNPGTYDEGATLDINKNITVESTGTAAETIIADINSSGTGGNVVISASKTSLLQGVVLDGFTIMGNLTGGAALDITGEGATVQNCVFTKAGTSTTAVGQTMIQYSAAPAVYGCTITGNIIDTTLGAVADAGINVTSAARMLTITGNTFAVDMTAAYGQDEAIQTAGGASATTLTVISANTITGTSGNGINVTGGVAYLTGNTLSNLWTALDIDAGSVTVTTETMTGNGVAISTTMPTGAPAVDIKGGTVTITNSTIADSLGYAVRVGATATPANISIMFNQITGNARNVHTSAVGLTNATHNWWGDAAGPATGTVVGASATTLVDTTGYLGSDATGSFTANAGSLLTRTTAGVDVTTTQNTGKPVPALIGVGNYTDNPQAATPEAAVAGGFYDVYVKEATAADTASVLIKFYNANISENTIVYVWSELRGDWALCEPISATAAATQGVNTFSGYAWVQVTAATIPAISDLAGTPFALLEPVVVEEEPEVPAAPAILSPTFGDEAASVKPTFTWTASEGATSYEFVLAEEIGQDDKFAIIDYSATTATHGHVAREQLKYSTVYNWRVRAVNDIGKGDWTTGFFTTEAEPVPEPEPVPPVVVRETPPTPAPEIILEVPPSEAPVQVIPDYLLWTVIAVGAVLIIAVIALIVRTRRVT